MIHANVQVVDLDPLTWRNLGLIAPFAELATRRPQLTNTLSILHDHGKVLRVDQPEGLTVDLPQSIDNPMVVAQTLYERLPSLERIQIFDKARLAAYSNAVQQLDWNTLSLDEFYLSAWKLAEGDPIGLCSYPPRPDHWNHFYFDALRKHLQALPDGATLALGVYEDHTPWFTLIAQVRAGEIRLITTFETLARSGVSYSSDTLDTIEHICTTIAQQIGPLAYALFCARDVFEHWLVAPAKAAILEQASRAGHAFVYTGVLRAVGARIAVEAAEASLNYATP